MVSIKLTVLAVALVTLCVLTTDTLAAYVSCCRRYMTGKLRFPDIKGFSVQKSSATCPISAIIFHTKNGKRCADPALEWVMYYVNRIEYMSQKVHEKAEHWPEDSLASTPDKIIKDGPPPMTLCKW